LLHEKIKGPLLDDVIDMILARDEQMNALFTFADGPEAKYLSQFIPSAVTFVNHIPAELLSKFNITCRHSEQILNPDMIS
jgi:hypothetical protein